MTLQDKLDAIQAWADNVLDRRPSKMAVDVTRLINALRECMSQRDKLIAEQCDGYNRDGYVEDCDIDLLTILEAE